MPLRTQSLTREFGGLTAVDDVEIELDGDELCSLIGPNGAGKTTLFDLLTGTLAPTAGTIEYRHDGEWVDVTDRPVHRTARLGIHRSYQITNVFPQASVLENVRVAAQAHGEGSGSSWSVVEDAAKFWRNVHAFGEYYEEARSILRRVGLADAADAPAATLSHGDKRLLEIAIALAGDPDVLLLDEPNAGVSSDGVERVVDIVRDVATDHAVLLVEHNVDLVMAVSDRIVVLHQGSVIADGPPDAIRDDPAVQQAYLGGYERGEPA